MQVKKSKNIEKITYQIYNGSAIYVYVDSSKQEALPCKNKASTIEVYAIKKIKIKERNHKIDLSWLGDLYLHSLFKVTDACPPKSVFTPFT